MAVLIKNAEFRVKRGRRIGVECQCADAPTITRSMHIALDNLKLDHLMVVYPGEKRYTSVG